MADELRELVGVEVAPLEELHAALVHQVHGRGVDRDVLGTERCDGCRTRVHAHKVDRHVAVTLECGCDGERRGD